jgi:hypothetical protein
VRSITRGRPLLVYTARVKIVWALAVTAAAATGLATALLTGGGCASNCAENCPAGEVIIHSANYQELAEILTNLVAAGPACPPASSVTCLGDRVTASCSYVRITAPQPGTCDVGFAFSDRPNEVLHLEFGPTINANGSCCKGYPPVGPTTYTIPIKPTGPIYSGSVDAGTYSTDAVVVLTDAGTGGAGGAAGAGGLAGAGGAAVDAGQGGAGGAP